MKAASTNDIIAGTALSLGVGQVILSTKRVYESDDVSSYSVPYLTVGIIGSLLWLTVQYRTGANYSSIYTSIALVSQLYILRRVVSKLNTKRDTQ
jgi:hypothetical protein